MSLNSGAALRTSREVLRPLRFATVYAAAFLVLNVVLILLPGSAQGAAELAASTNIAQLATEPLFVLPASALIDQGELWLWIPLILLLVGGLESVIGTRRTMLAVFGAHCVATLLSEGILLARIAAHLEPSSELHVVDVGPSYVILAALAGCLVVGGWRLQLSALAVGALILPGLLHGLSGLDMTAVGHLSALLLGAVLTVVVTSRFAVRTDRVQVVNGWLQARRPAVIRIRPRQLGLRLVRPRQLRPRALRPPRSPAPAWAGDDTYR